MILGIASLPLMILPFGLLIGIPAAVVAVVLGIKSLKSTNNTEAIIGIATGGLTLLLTILAIIVLAIVLSGFRIE